MLENCIEFGRVIRIRIVSTFAQSAMNGFSVDSVSEEIRSAYVETILRRVFELSYNFSYAELTQNLGTCWMSKRKNRVTLWLSICKNWLLVG